MPQNLYAFCSWVKARKYISIIKKQFGVIIAYIILYINIIYSLFSDTATKSSGLTEIFSCYKPSPNGLNYDIYEPEYTRKDDVYCTMLQHIFFKTNIVGYWDSVSVYHMIYEYS